MGRAGQLSLAGYAVNVTGTSPTLTLQVEQSCDRARWMNRNVYPELNAFALSTSSETIFAAHDGNPSVRATLPFARLRIALGGTNPTGRVRIWATGRNPEGETTPVSILGAASVLQWCRADMGVTLNGSTVSNWADQSGSRKDYTQATATKQPTFSASGGPNSTAMMTLDGVDDDLVATTAPNLPAPGTTPTYVWLVIRQESYTAGEGIFGPYFAPDGNDYIVLVQNPTSPSLRQANGGTAQDNSGLAVGTWGRVELAFTNSTADFIKCASTSVTGANVGNNSGQTGRILGRRTGLGSLYTNFSIAEILYANRIPTTGERAALDAYCTERYGPGLV